MADEAPVVNEPVVADTTPTDSTPVETASSEVVDEFDGLGDVSLIDPQPVKEVTDSKAEVETKESKDEESKETEESKEADTDEATETDTDPQPQGKAEERKQQLNNEIRDLVSQRNAIRAEVEKANAEVYQPATDEELLGQVNPETGEYYNSLEAKVAAMQQQQEYDKYNSQVAEAQLTLGSEAQRSLRDFSMFDENSKDYNKELAAQADEILGANLIKDPNTGQIVGSHTSPYTIYKTIASAYSIAGAKAQGKAQKATETMLANADTSSNSPNTGSGDSMEDLLQRIGDYKFLQ